MKMTDVGTKDLCDFSLSLWRSKRSCARHFKEREAKVVPTHFLLKEKGKRTDVS
jgi:hypothetical protein